MASFVIIANFSQLNFIIVRSFFFFFMWSRISNFFQKNFTTQQNLLVLCKLFYSYFTAADRSHLFSANLISPQQQNTHLFSAIFLFLFHHSRQKSLILCKPYFTAAAEYSLILCNLFYTIFINSLIQSPLNTLCSVTSNF